MCYWYSALLVAIITVASLCNEDSLESIGDLKWISNRDAVKVPCYIPTPPEHGVLRTHRRLCPSGADSPACRLVPGTPVADTWVMYLGCQPGFNFSLNVSATICRDGRWRPSLPTCVFANASTGTEDSLGSVADSNQTLQREAVKVPCYIPTPPEHLVLSTHRRLCPSGADSPACRLVPGTPVADQWIMYLRCQPGFNLSREVKVTICRDGQWRQPLPTCVLDNSTKQYFLGLRSGGRMMFDLFDVGDNMDQVKPQTIQFPSNTSKSIMDFTIDCTNRLLYWAEYPSCTIKRAAFDGGGLTTFLEREEVGGSPELTLDWVNRKLYWSKYKPKTYGDEIKAVNLEDGKTETIISTNSKIDSIIVHPALRKIFWIARYGTVYAIEYVFLGNLSCGVIREPSQKLDSMAIDWTTQELCWTIVDVGTIECQHLESGIRRTILTGLYYPIAIAITAENYYWSDRSSIKRIHKVSTSTTTLPSPEIWLKHEFVKLEFIHRTCPRLKPY